MHSGQLPRRGSFQFGRASPCTAADHAHDELGGPESTDAWLIKEAAEAPLQLPKNRKMIVQLRETLFASEKSAFKIREFGTASRVGFASLDLREERHR
jgi:hypothetical protein